MMAGLLGAGATTRSTAVAADPAPLSATTESAYRPAAVGVPERTPVLSSKASPGGAASKRYRVTALRAASASVKGWPTWARAARLAANPGGATAFAGNSA